MNTTESPTSSPTPTVSPTASPAFEPTDALAPASYAPTSQPSSDVVLLNKLYVASVIMSSLAIAASLFVIVTYVRFPVLQKRSLELVMWLSFSGMMVNVVNAAYNDNNDHDNLKCTVQGLLVQFFAFSIVGWAFTIGAALFSIVVLRDAFISRPLTHALVWGVAAVSCVPILALGQFGSTGGPSCWIQPGRASFHSFFSLAFVLWGSDDSGCGGRLCRFFFVVGWVPMVAIPPPPLPRSVCVLVQARKA